MHYFLVFKFSLCPIAQFSLPPSTHVKPFNGKSAQYPPELILLPSFMKMEKSKQCYKREIQNSMCLLCTGYTFLHGETSPHRNTWACSLFKMSRSGEVPERGKGEAHRVRSYLHLVFQLTAVLHISGTVLHTDLLPIKAC